MTFVVGSVFGFVAGWLFCKRPELIEKVGNWIWTKIKCVWNRVF